MKAWAVLLFCSPNTRPQCSAVCGERVCSAPENTSPCVRWVGWEEQVCLPG